MVNELTMPSMSRCPACGAVLPPDGQCINCLLALGLNGSDPSKSVRDESQPRQHFVSFPGYEILSEVGRGAMGIIYRARQEQAGRNVALKVVLSGQFASPSELARFRQEAETAGSLDHPNIIPIYHVGEHDGRPFFTMPLIEEGNLSTRIADLGSDPRFIARLIAKVARAVHHAHQRGILHRDLKPSNILLDAHGEPHVTDFGLAKRAASSVELTATGAALGTPGYMAPEQALGESKQVTTAADIFSLGAIFYELLTGRPPFQADTPLAIVRKTIEEDPKPPSAVRQKINRDLETICLKCLAKAPGRRYRSAEAMAEDLECWLRNEPISARPPTHWERVVNHVRLHPIRAALIAVAVLAVLLTGTFFYASSRTYYWLMGKIADEHLIVPPDEDGIYRLQLGEYRGDVRCTRNFWKQPFWNKYNKKGRYARIEFMNMPPDIAGQLQVRVFADVPAMPDPAKTPPLTNGEVFFLGDSNLRERAFYLGEANLRASNVVLRAPQAAVSIILLGRPGEPDPNRPIGRWRQFERE